MQILRVPTVYDPVERFFLLRGAATMHAHGYHAAARVCEAYLYAVSVWA